MELEWAAGSEAWRQALSSPRRRPGSSSNSRDIADSALDSGFRRNDEEDVNYRLDIKEQNGLLVLDWQPLLEALIADIRGGAAPATMAAQFHDALALAIAGTAARIGETTVVLSGGCFQNARLTERTLTALKAAGLEPVRQERVPPNDGGLALGQAWWAGRFQGD
jgi:hydrogenase maturation factor HypF (carbamoyltransferase family)